MPTVILAEKPDQARHYASAFKQSIKKDGYFEIIDNRFFQDKTFITYGFGHLVELAEPECYKEEWKFWDKDNLPILPDKFIFNVKNDKQKQFKIVKKLLDESTRIIVATDSDREGENIARSIIKKSGNENKEVSRLWINSLEEDEIIRGFNNLRDGNDYITSYQEAQTRQISDWLVGINITRIYTLMMREKGINGVFSVGRVQTPTLAMIYKRQKDIQNFKPEDYFEITANVTAKNGEYTAKYEKRFKTADEVKSLFAEHKINKSNDGLIKSVDVVHKTGKSPKLFSLSALQSHMNKLKKISPADTLKAVQSLYEAKLLSYPRTDCNFITEGEFSYLKDNLNKYLQFLQVTIDDPELSPKKRYVDGKKVQEHYAIIPTRNVISQDNYEKLDEKQKAIYVEVVKNTIAMFHHDYLYDETIIKTDICGLEFKTIGKTETSKGWKLLFPDSKDAEKPLPTVSVGEGVKALINPKKGVTSPPKPYTEGQIITMMKTAGKLLEDESEKDILKETEGIGTEATRANIIETLKKQQYITVNKNTVSVTEKGIVLCEALANSKLSSPSFTAEWEAHLKRIREGSSSQSVFLEAIKKFIKYLLAEAPKALEDQTVTQNIFAVQESQSLGTCPVCGGKVTDKGSFYGCSNYKDGCKFSIPKVLAGKKLPQNALVGLIKNRKSIKVKGFKSKKGTKFDAFLVMDEQNKIHFQF